jgi:hypothetical protein
MASSLRVYAMCHRLHAQAHAAAAAASAGGLMGRSDLRLRMGPLLSFATRAQLQGLRLQLALLDREFDDLDYDALRALDADNPPGVTAMSDTEINRLPFHTYKAAPVLPTSHSQQSEGAPLPSVTVNMAATDSCLVSCFPVPPCSYYLMLANLFHLIVFALTWNFKHRSNLVMGFFLMVRLGNSEHFVEICNLSDPLTPETTSPLSNSSAC